MLVLSTLKIQIYIRRHTHTNTYTDSLRNVTAQNRHNAAAHISFVLKRIPCSSAVCTFGRSFALAIRRMLLMKSTSNSNGNCQKYTHYRTHVRYVQYTRIQHRVNVIYAVNFVR